MAQATKQRVADRHGAGMQLATFEPEPDTSGLRYDYEQIDAAHRRAVQDAALDIQRREKRAAEDLIIIGQRLIEVKTILPDGKFEDWMAKEFAYSRTMATELMNVARRFGERGTLNVPIGTTVMRLLAAPSVPEEAIEDVIEFVEREGRSPQVEEAKHIIKLHKAPPKMITVQATVTTPEPKPAGMDYIEAVREQPQYVTYADLLAEIRRWLTRLEETGDSAMLALTILRRNGGTNAYLHQLKEHLVGIAYRENDLPRAIDELYQWEERRQEQMIEATERSRSLRTNLEFAGDGPTPDELEAIAIVEAELAQEDAERAERDATRLPFERAAAPAEEVPTMPDDLAEAGYRYARVGKGMWAVEHDIDALSSEGESRSQYQSNWHYDPADAILEARAHFAKYAKPEPDAAAIDPFDGWLAAMPPDLDLRRCLAILELAKTTAKRALDIQGRLYNSVYGAMPTWSLLIRDMEKEIKRG